MNDGVWIAANINNGRIRLGDDVIVGPYTIFHSGNHRYKNTSLPIRKQGYEFAPIIIEENVWIGSRVTILAGTTIGKGSVIAAGSVVTKCFPEKSLIAGVPGKIIKSWLCENNGNG